MKKHSNIKIGIDMHSVNGTYQGTRTHVLEIFSRVIPLCPDINFYLFLENPATLSDFSTNYNLSNVTTIKIPGSSPYYRLVRFFPKMQKDLNLDYFHSQYIFPFPLFSKGIVTIHDILFESYPQFFSQFFKFRSKILIKKAAKKAEHIFTVSNYSKKSIINEYAISSNKISVIYNAASNIFSDNINRNDYLKDLSIKSKDYILSVGRSDPRKNYANLIKAYAIIAEKVPPLIIVDSTSKHLELLHIIDRYGLNEKVKIISNINNKVLSELYKNATLFVYPSFAEGFGIPVVEAMASGLAIISSDSTSLKEVGDEAVLFTNPSDSNDMAEKMLLLLQNNTLREKYQKLGLIRNSAFSWDKSAESVANYYKTLNP